MELKLLDIRKSTNNNKNLINIDLTPHLFISQHNRLKMLRVKDHSSNSCLIL